MRQIPLLQSRTVRQFGCQIDYMIQTRFNTLDVCEVKFSKNPAGAGVIAAVREKTKHPAFPQMFSIRLVLIHLNGVEGRVLDQRYFDKIIDFSPAFPIGMNEVCENRNNFRVVLRREIEGSEPGKEIGREKIRMNPPILKGKSLI